ncbi:MAG: hypothetical protein ACPGQL_04270 [Thermoplasmatota archaeon]
MHPLRVVALALWLLPVAAAQLAIPDSDWLPVVVIACVVGAFVHALALARGWREA